MRDAANRLEPYAARFLELREPLVRILGSRTVDLIIERAVVEIRASYPEMALIRVTGDGVDLQALEAALEPKSEEQIRAAFDALSGVVMLVLARLLGKEVATRLVENDGAPKGYTRGPG